MRVTNRRTQWLAGGLLGLIVAAYGVTLTGSALGWGRCLPAATLPEGVAACDILAANNDLGGVLEVAGFGAMGLLFAVLGTVIAMRRSGERLGWIFTGAGAIFVSNGATLVYTVHGAAEAPGSLPGVTTVAVASEVLGGPVVFVPFVFFFLLFPDGRLPSRRWRFAVWAAAAATLLTSVDSAFKDGPLRLAPLTPNPVGGAWLAPEVRNVLEISGVLLLLLAVVASVVSLIVRFRRSRGVQRQQMRWFTAAAAYMGVTLACAPLFWATPSLEPLWGPAFLAATASLPIAATIAILRYRLYDLDVLVNRALVYGAMTGLLGAAYLGGVFLLQALLATRSGGSNAAVAISTLGVAALFRPLRSRLQAFIDRRFYRRKYDAAQEVERFTSQLRQETDLGALREDLLRVTRDTVQPAAALIWLRQSSARPLSQ